MIRVIRDAAGLIYIDGREDPIAGGLQATLSGTVLTIANTQGGRPLVVADYTQIDDGTGIGFASADAAMAYLAAQFATRLGTPEKAYPVAVADGQSLIPLEQAPTDLNSVVLLVNGVQYAAPAIVASSIAVTWRGPFALSADDDVRLTYF